MESRKLDKHRSVYRFEMLDFIGSKIDGQDLCLANLRSWIDLSSIGLVSFKKSSRF